MVLLPAPIDSSVSFLLVLCSSPRSFLKREHQQHHPNFISSQSLILTDEKRSKKDDLEASINKQRREGRSEVALAAQGDRNQGSGKGEHSIQLHRHFLHRSRNNAIVRRSGKNSIRGVGRHCNQRNTTDSDLHPQGTPRKTFFAPRQDQHKREQQHSRTPRSSRLGTTGQEYNPEPFFDHCGRQIKAIEEEAREPCWSYNKVGNCSFHASEESKFSLCCSTATYAPCPVSSCFINCQLTTLILLFGVALIVLCLSSSHGNNIQSWKIISWRTRKNTLSTLPATTPLNKESTIMVWPGGCWTSPQTRATCSKNSRSRWFGTGSAVTTSPIHSLQRRNVGGSRSTKLLWENTISICIGCIDNRILMDRCFLLKLFEKKPSILNTTSS